MWMVDSWWRAVASAPRDGDPWTRADDLAGIGADFMGAMGSAVDGVDIVDVREHLFAECRHWLPVSKRVANPCRESAAQRPDRGCWTGEVA
jgi:hypothetical protein